MITRESKGLKAMESTQHSAVDTWWNMEILIKESLKVFGACRGNDGGWCGDEFSVQQRTEEALETKLIKNETLCRLCFKDENEM